MTVAARPGFSDSPHPVATASAEHVWQLSAARIAELVRAGEMSALAVVEAHIARIEDVNPHLNAVVVKRYDAARSEAREIDRRRLAGEALPPLAGVPVTIKDCIDVAALPSTFGLPSRANSIAAADEMHVARLRQAGAIVLGKTNVAQLLIYAESDNPLYGRTVNPWNPERTCGGSSGGEGAIIAAGGAPMGLGTDIGGSVRYPATFCGIAGLKPTAGRCPDYAGLNLPLGQREIASQVGVLARTVDDLALGMRIIDPGPGGSLGPVLPLGDIDAVDVAKLRIGVYADDGVMASSPAVRRAVREAASALQAVGAGIIEWTPPRLPEAYHLAMAIFTADGGALLKEMLGRDPAHRTVKTLRAVFGRSRATLSLLAVLLRSTGQRALLRSIAALGNTRTVDYWRLCDRLLRYRLDFAAAMAAAPGGGLDCILGPACALPAFPHGATTEFGTAGVNTLLYNVLGYPAGVVPVTRVRAGEETERPPSRDIVERMARICELNSAGLPVGVQIAAAPWQEHVALAAMRAVEVAARRSEDFPHSSKLPT